MNLITKSCKTNKGNLLDLSIKAAQQGATLEEISFALATILKKISPDASQVIDQFTSQEENVVLPVSVVKNYAVMKYPSSSEQESLQGFITELSESQSDDTNVPPENMQASQGMMAPEPDMTNTDAIDQGQTEIA